MKEKVFTIFEVDLDTVIPFTEIEQMKENFVTITGIIETSVVDQSIKDSVNDIVVGFESLNGECTDINIC